MWHLDRAFRAAEDRELINPQPVPQTDEEFLARCQERDARLERDAVEAERDGDTEGAWFAMACRAENRRFMQRVQAHINAGGAQ
jgi:hypothetical protein